MMIKVEDLKNLANLGGIGTLGNFEAKRDGNELKISVASADNTALVIARLTAEFDDDEDISIYANEEVFVKKYLDNFPSKIFINVKTSEDVVALSDDELTLYMPQLAPEVASKSTKSLDVNSLPPRPIRVSFLVKLLHRAIRAAEKLSEDVIKFDIKTNDINIKIRDRNKVNLSADFENPNSTEITFIFSINMLKRITEKASGEITFEFPENMSYPVGFSYEVGNIKVNGFVVGRVYDD